jgi:hypothetical protein
VAKYWLELNPHSIALSVMEAFALLSIFSRALAAKIKEERISRKAAKESGKVPKDVPTIFRRPIFRDGAAKVQMIHFGDAVIANNL